MESIVILDLYQISGEMPQNSVLNKFLIPQLLILLRHQKQWNNNRSGCIPFHSPFLWCWLPNSIHCLLFEGRGDWVTRFLCGNGNQRFARERNPFRIPRQRQWVNWEGQIGPMSMWSVGNDKRYSLVKRRIELLWLFESNSQLISKYF